jgi:hypothetical protein
MAERPVSELRLVCLCDSSGTAVLLAGGLARLGLEPAVLPSAAAADEWLDEAAGRGAVVPNQSWEHLPVDGAETQRWHRIFFVRGPAVSSDINEALGRGVAAVVTLDEVGELDLSLAQVLEYLQRLSVS